MTTRRLRTELVTGLLLAAGAVLVGSGGGAAWAESPAQAGWWSQTNPGSVAGSPTAPTPPDVPAGGLLVEGGMSSASGPSDAGPTAFGAVVYRIPAGQSPGRLTLGISPGSATTPSVTLELCPLTSVTINTEHGGSMADAPGFSCTANVTAQPSATGDSYTFDVSKLVAAGTLAVAVLPTSPTDRVVLASPGDPSLSLSSASGPLGSGGAAGNATGGASTNAPAGGPTGAPAADPGAGPTGDATSAPSAGPSVVSSLPGDTTASAAGAGVSPTAASPTRSAGSGGSAAAFPVPDSSGPADAKPLAVVLVIVGFLIGGGIWLGAGRAAARADLRSNPEGAP